MSDFTTTELETTKKYPKIFVISYLKLLIYLEKLSDHMKGIKHDKVEENIIFWKNCHYEECFLDNNFHFLTEFLMDEENSVRLYHSGDLRSFLERT